MQRLILLSCLVASAFAYQDYYSNNNFDKYSTPLANAYTQHGLYNQQVNYAPEPTTYQNGYQSYEQESYATPSFANSGVERSSPASYQDEPLYQPQYEEPTPSYQAQEPEYQPQMPQYVPAGKAFTRYNARRNNRRNQRKNNRNNVNYKYQEKKNVDYGNDEYSDYDSTQEEFDYPTPRFQSNRRRQQITRQRDGKSSYHQSQSHSHQSHHGHRSHGHGHAHKYVPVVVKKKTHKKKKIISVQHGFYIQGGTQLFGKFSDLHSCQKACELTPTCFAGDFNPWLKKCFMHNNITACASMKTHPQIIHFKKIPCSLVETTRGLITIGTQMFKGIEQKHIKSLTDCIKKCANLGGGIADITANIASTPQLCFGIDYDFASHKCYFHTTNHCGVVAVVLTPENLVAKASSINILLCPQAIA